MTTEIFEQTLVLIKPDAVRNGLTGYILSQLSEFHTGLRFAGAKIVKVSRMLAEEHYAEHKGKHFFPGLLEYIMGCLHYPDAPEMRQVIAFIYQGGDAIRKIRDISGPTNPHAARDQKPGCIRALGTIVPVLDAAGKQTGDRMDNLIHASANAADAEREIKLWFRPADIPPLMLAYETALCKEHFYFRDGKLLTAHEPGSVCLLSPGDVAWKSDLDALLSLRAGKPASCSVGTVAAKFLINNQPAD
jgi:nucleoside-diphosphate kinase